MKKAFRGYTIIEVLLVLAISTSLLFAAIAVFKGQQGETQFSQAVQDLNSKIVNYANQVSAGTFPDSENYGCTNSVTGPTLKNASIGLGSREDCIFLGRAIHVQANNGNINIYTVVGNRADSNGNSLTSVADAKPNAAITTAGGISFVLNDSYTLSGGSKIKSAWAENSTACPAVSPPSPSACQWYMAGIYSDLSPNGGGTVSNTQLDLWGYNLANNVGLNTTIIPYCIQGNNGYCKLSQAIDKWNLCVENSSGSRTFVLTITSHSSGLTTEVKDLVC